MSKLYHKLPEFCFSYDVDEAPSESKFHLHMHDDFEILCVICGNVGYIVEGHTYDLRPGSVIIMRSAETHKLVVRKNERYERFVLNFSPSTLEKHGLPTDLLAPFLDRGLGEKNHYPPNSFDAVKPIDLLKQMTQSLAFLSPEATITAFLPSLLSILHTAFEKKQRHTESAQSDLGQQLINYVNDHLFEELTLSGIAAQMHISESHLNRVFRAASGTSVYHYVLSKRLIAAQQMILRGEGAQSASQRCGFRDYSAFYRLYKKRFRISPAASKPK